MSSVVFENRNANPTRRILRVGKRLSDYGVETVLCLSAGTGNAAAYAQECGIPVRRVLRAHSLTQRSKKNAVVGE